MTKGKADKKSEKPKKDKSGKPQKRPEKQVADRSKKSLGKRGEDAAAKYLESCGHVILDRNFRCRAGEIDIVAVDIKDGSLVFAEVKTRRGVSFGLPCESVTAEKRRHLRLAAETYLTYRSMGGEPCRMDVIELIEKSGKFYLHHLRNCF